MATNDSTRRPIVLSGFMGTGKSTVGPRLAARLGVPFVDTDTEIERAAGARIPDLWRAEGEAAFRKREVDLVERLFANPEPRVIAFGGGTVTSKRARHLALERAIVVTLTATPETIAARASGALADRPNLALGGDPVARARELLELRAEAYAECHAMLATDAQEPDVIVDAIVALAERGPIAVPLGARSYVVDVVHDAPSTLTDAIARVAPSSVVVVTDAHVHRERHAALDAALAPLALRRTLVTLPAGEEHKTLASVATIWDAALGAGVDRDALVVGFGGGVVGDLAGFAASSLLRGVRTVIVPTTLLSMVDASVGGKTGFDHPAGKNLLGAFHQPSGVVVDLAHLTTLPVRERAAGLAEVVKIALTSDAELLGLLESDAARIATGDPAALMPIVRRAVEAKVRVVRDDEREQGLRALLNLGHTLGHALEAHGQFRRHLHGEAVAVGTVLELGVAARLGWTPAALVDRARSLFARLKLPTQVPRAELAAAWPYVLTDKKRAMTRIRFPVVAGPGEARLERVELETLREAALALS
jgi:shikimate kinase/3-dehydroquinate synthase